MPNIFLGLGYEEALGVNRFCLICHLNEILTLKIGNALGFILWHRLQMRT